MRPLALVASITLLATSLRALQSVHVVNGGTGNVLQAAIDAAADGDTVLVHGGSFDDVTIARKALTLVAEPPLGTLVSSLAVSAIPAGKRCVVAGIDVAPPPNTIAVLVTGCDGSVRVEDVRANRDFAHSVDALVVTASSDVACVRSAFHGGAQIPTPGPNATPSYVAGRGVVCVGSALALYTCFANGGAGQTDHFINPAFATSGAGAGGVALSVDGSSTVFAGRSTFEGGVGGDGRALACVAIPCGIAPSAGADGGAGIVAAPGATVATLDVVVQGGAGGAGGAGGQCCPQTAWLDASAGQPGAAEQGSITHFSGGCTTIFAPTVVRAGDMLPLSITGTPGDVIFLAVSSQTRYAFDPFYSGVFLFGPAARRSSFGIVPGSGVLNVSIPAGSLPSGAQSVERYLQVLARDPMGQLRLGAATFVTVLDPAF